MKNQDSYDSGVIHEVGKGGHGATGGNDLLDVTGGYGRRDRRDAKDLAPRGNIGPRGLVNVAGGYEREDVKSRVRDFRSAIGHERRSMGVDYGNGISGA